MMKLYTYWRSSAAYRVRIALAMKGIEFQSIPVHLIKDGGQQHHPEYAKLNPSELVPTLVDGDVVLNQSLAIIDYLEEKYPSIPLYPDEFTEKYQVKALALDIACDTHPLNNLRVLQYLSGTLAIVDEQKQAWINDWITTGFSAFEAKIKITAGHYCFGDKLTVADICLIPQVYNAKRFGISLSDFPTIERVFDCCMQQSVVIAASPEQQADAL